MKQIILGLLYDTERATELCSADGTALYKTESGNYFVTEGGSITAKPEEYAKDFLGKYNIEKYVEMFGNPTIA